MSSSQSDAKRVKLSQSQSHVEHPTPSLTDSGSDLSDDTSEESDSDSSEDLDDEQADVARTRSSLATPSDTESSTDEEEMEGEAVEQRIHFPGSDLPLKERLAAFLPQMKAANDSLEELKQSGRLKEVVLDDVEEGRPHIEMNLGLGVLEEQRDGDSSSGSDDEDAEESVRDASVSAVRQNQDVQKDTRVMDKLMGQPAGKRKTVIQEVEDVG
ncbi:hypothetical protein CAC42_2432 [Sphaceloma murrayae]|uniref:Uncharacterized protein n=1 Tax=Sphaceloma murrayae TaxID=2082308 RepID=A0A2K1QW16_9PEZI|nr:hypothetical protein CAC42_2432 [Sphaceloma murrayae]